MDEDKISERMILLDVILAVFLFVVWINWLTADSPFWVHMLTEAGFAYEEINTVLMFRSILFQVLSVGSSVGLLLLNYYLGKRYKLTRRSTIVFIFVLIIPILLGLFLGYGIKQLQLPQYPILNWNIALEIPNELSYTIIWCMSGMLAGNYKREIEQKEGIS